MGYPSTSAENHAALVQTVRDRFRCPEEFLDFRLAGELSPAPAYFRFGANTTCYGRSWEEDGRPQPAPPLRDLLSCVSVDGTQLVLPFDPNEIIDNLRLERYPGCQLNERERTLKNAYYWLRPVTNRWIRSRVQRFRVAGWQKRAFPRWPVDSTVDNLCENLLLLALRASGVSSLPFIWFWPNGARCCVSMTHDVETAAGRDFCGRLLDIDDSFGFKSSFQVVPEGPYSVPPAYLSEIRDRGFELCVQDLNHDGRLFDERESFLRRAARINHYAEEYGATGFRAAVLYRKPEWFSDLEFSFDMSIPNVGHLDPQRGGCCTVTPYFVGDRLELPLTTIQDYTLFHMLGERSTALWKLQLELILARNGLATFLVHPDYITGPKEQAVYMDLLAVLAALRERENIWAALPREIDVWWRARNSMSIVREDNSWRIVGAGAERAVLAFAKNVDGQLVYELANPQRGELLDFRTHRRQRPQDGCTTIV